MKQKNKKKGSTQKRKNAAVTASAVEVNDTGTGSSSDIIDGSDTYVYVDPLHVRFQHSRIRPYFSGCGRSVGSTLQLIRDGLLSPAALPPILLIPLESKSSKMMVPGGNTADKDESRRLKHLQKKIGNQDVQPQQEYVSLNNRRLWVLKECRKEGLLQQFDNQIKARVRLPRSAQERARYSPQNCSLEAKFIRETPVSSSNPKRSTKLEEHMLTNQKGLEANNLSTKENPAMMNNCSASEHNEKILNEGTASEKDDYSEEEMGSSSSQVIGFSALLNLDSHDEESSSDSDTR